MPGPSSARRAASRNSAVQLSGLDADSFLRDAWQKRPLLIRGAWDAWRNPLDPDELAGLACEDGVESRLVTRSAGKLKVEHGPFAEARFGRLGRKPWTLLVQAVDHHVPAVAELLSSFRFVPNWRVDDVMVSYAVDGGGVGPHFDQYDVFLIQGLGRRRWRVGGRCDRDTELLPHDDLRLLARFDPIDEWVLDPGDMLYVPPGVAHDGVAVGDDCMTYSIGFRAPSQRELIEGWALHVAECLSEDDRYADPGLVRQNNPGEITADALARLQASVSERLLDRDAFARWFGRFNSAPKNPEIDWSPEQPIDVEGLRSLALVPLTLTRNPASRFSFIRGEGSGATLFVDGESYDCTDECARLVAELCADCDVMVGPDRLSSDAALKLIVSLHNRGALALETD